MKGHRIMAVVWRHLYHFRRNWDRLGDALYWPVLDLVLWGLSTRWLAQQESPASPALLTLLTAIVFWQILWRANYEISINMLEETWCGNVVNLFASPLTVAEWVSGVMLTGLIKVVLSAAVGFGASWVLYSLNLLEVGYPLVPFLSMLILFGWSIGLFASGIVLRYGRSVATIAWMIPWLFAPFSAVYYPIAALPQWARLVSYLLPTTYVFEGMRATLAGERMQWDMLAASLVLNAIYLGLALSFFILMFEKRRGLGLQKLE